MTLSTFSFVLSALELLLGIPLLLSPGKTGQWLLKLMRHDLLSRVVFAFFFTLAFLVLTEGATIGADVAGLMRLVAWLTALKCLLYCWYPRFNADLAERFLSIPAADRFGGAVAVAAGVLFLMAGFALQ
jgi:hypothetical protein